MKRVRLRSASKRGIGCEEARERGIGGRAASGELLDVDVAERRRRARLEGEAVVALRLTGQEGERELLDGGLDTHNVLLLAEETHEAGGARLADRAH